MGDLSSRPAISVILPCYNEKDNILPLVKAIHSELHEHPHEIVVVDDKSPDGTYDVVKNAGLDYLRPFQRESEPSLGKSIRKGLEEARGDVFVIMDSDFNHPPSYLRQMISNLRFYDCVSASRFVYGGGMDTRFRHVGSWLFNIASRILTRTLITDSLFGYIAVKRPIMERLNYDEIFWGYGDYCIRLIYYLQRNNVSILQIPAVLGKRQKGESKSNLLKMLYSYSKAVLKLAFKKRRCA